MLARELIRDLIPPLKVTDNGHRALSWMEEFRLQYLPVIEEKKFLGLISETDILGMADRNIRLAEAALPLAREFIYENQHAFDAIRFVIQFNYPVVPVLNQDNEYAGIITVHDLIETFALINGVMIPGGIIHLTMKPKEYLFSSLAHLIESNDANIVSLSCYPSSDGSSLEIIIKVNRLDLTRILAALERHQYQIAGFYQQVEPSGNFKDRYDSLMTYLKV
jgi:Mg/Co/Ni transporter MgtE